MINSNDLKELEVAISENIFIRIQNWNLYLGDAGLAKELSLECAAYIEKGPDFAAQMGLKNIQALLGSKKYLSLDQLVTFDQVEDLAKILEKYY